MKKDIALRLAHKRPYERIERTPDQQIDVLVVVDQMLTGFDSKWINTLYLDKILQYENIIQAFSRTNRLFGNDKPFGVIRYYRRPHTMKRNVEDAVKLYSGDRPLGLFVDKLDKNLNKINDLFTEINDLFKSAGVNDFVQLPKEIPERKKFAELFKTLNDHIEAAKVQGFQWDKQIYTFSVEETGQKYTIKESMDETIYKTLALRYKELSKPDGSDGNEGPEETSYDIDGYLTTIDTDDINADYMNSRFDKYMKLLNQGSNDSDLKQAEDELHKTFATLTQEEQKFANIFLHDIQRGDVIPETGKTLRDYITEYMTKAKDDQIHRLAATFGLDEEKLRNLMSLKITESNINEFGRFDALKSTVDKKLAKAYFEKIEGKPIIPPKVPMKIDKLLREFILSGGFELNNRK